MATPADVLKTIKDKEVKFVDLRFTDTRGKEQHVSVPAKQFTQDTLLPMMAGFLNDTDPNTNLAVFSALPSLFNYSPLQQLEETTLQCINQLFASTNWRTNVSGTRALLDAITEHRVPTLVFSSTAATYGEPDAVPITEAEQTGIPVYVLRTNTVVQIESALADVFGLEVRPDPFDLAMREAQSAIDEILRGSRSMVELRPQNSFVRRAQHELARSAKLQSLSSGEEPRRRVRIYRNGR